jgi:hypothetical protein
MSVAVRRPERPTVDWKLRDTNSNSVPSRPSMKATPRKSGTRKTRIPAIEVSKKTSRKPPTSSLAA